MRKELKYEILYEDYIKLVELLDSVIKRDKYSNEKGEYSIRSIYFENLQKENSNRKITKRFRIRMYNKDKESIYLERKRNYNGLVEKDKYKITMEDVINILDRKI